MKIFKYILLIVALIAVQKEVSAQCVPSESIKVCIPKLVNGFHFLKSYEINGRGGRLDKVEYSYPFASNVISSPCSNLFKPLNVLYA